MSRSTTAARMAARVPGARPATVTADWLFSQLPADGSTQRWYQSFGLVGGVERFSGKPMRRSADGSRVELLRPNGDILMGLPLGKGRTLRTFVKDA